MWYELGLGKKKKWRRFDIDSQKPQIDPVFISAHI